MANNACGPSAFGTKGCGSPQGAIPTHHLARDQYSIATRSSWASADQPAAASGRLERGVQTGSRGRRNINQQV